MATGILPADTSVTNPHPRAKIHTRTRARYPPRVASYARARYPRACLARGYARGYAGRRGRRGDADGGRGHGVDHRWPRRWGDADGSRGDGVRGWRRGDGVHGWQRGDEIHSWGGCGQCGRRLGWIWVTRTAAERWSGGPGARGGGRERWPAVERRPAARGGGIAAAGGGAAAAGGVAAGGPRRREGRTAG